MTLLTRLLSLCNPTQLPVLSLRLLGRVLSVLACVFICFGASEASTQAMERGSTYRLSGSILVREYNADNQPSSGLMRSTHAPVILVRDTFERDGRQHVRFEFLPYSGGNSVLRRSSQEAARIDSLNALWVGDASNPKFFGAPVAELDAIGYVAAYEHYRGSGEWIIGALALPAILRFDPFNFSGSVALGPSIGRRWRMSQVHDYYGGIVLSVGTTSVQLTPENTNNEVEVATDRSAYYIAAGAVFEVLGMQLGAFVGKDHINAPNQSDWVYRNKPFFSLGIGASIFGGREPDKPVGGQ